MKTLTLGKILKTPQLPKNVYKLKVSWYHGDADKRETVEIDAHTEKEVLSLEYLYRTLDSNAREIETDCEAFDYLVNYYSINEESDTTEELADYLIESIDIPFDIIYHDNYATYDGMEVAYYDDNSNKYECKLS